MSCVTHRGLLIGAWVAWALAVVAFAIEIPLLSVNQGSEPAGFPPLVPAVEHLAFVAVATLSLLILRRQPGNRVGWAMMLVGATFPMEGFFVELTVYSLRTWGEVGLTVFSGWVSRWIWIGSQLAVPLVLLYYPDGRLPSPRWGWAVRYLGLVAAASFVGSAFNPVPMEELGGLPNPIGVDLPRLFVLIMEVITASSFILPLVGAGSLVPRFRRSAAVERQQLKLIAWVAVVAVLFYLVVGSGPVLEAGPIANSLANTVFTLFVGTAIAAGIVKYRVFEIDRIISRTLSYALVVAIIGAGYFGLVTVVTRLLPSQGSLAVAASTLGAAAVFNPLRSRVQTAAERRFNRSGYEAELVAKEFADQMRRSLSVGEIGRMWQETVVRAVEPTTSSLWLKDEALRNSSSTES